MNKEILKPEVVGAYADTRYGAVAPAFREALDRVMNAGRRAGPVR